MKQPIQARIVGSNSCSAFGVIISAPDPIAALAKKLVRDGWDADSPMVIWKADKPWRRVEHIGHPNQMKIRAKRSDD
jgi:hypothetical protein